MKTAVVALFGLGLVLSVFGEKIRYDNYKVCRFTPTDEVELSLLNNLTNNNGLLFWAEPSHVGRPVDIMFPPHLQGDMLEFLQKRIPSRLLTDNVQRLMDVEARGILKTGMAHNWNEYSQLEAIEAYLDAKVAEHPTIAGVVNIGKTYENRDLKLLKIAKPSSQQKPAIWIDGGIHAREWITPAVVTWVIEQLLNSNDADIQKITEDFDVYIIPVLNPDGYAYTFTGNRMWRKTRSHTDSPFGCRGADPNRNWDYEFNTGGSSGEPCSDSYHGGTGFSQVEIKAASDFYNTIASQTKMFLSVHSYSQFVLLPYGYSADRYPDYEEYMRIGQAAADAIETHYGTEFTVGNIVDILYPASGGSIDWIKGVHDTSVVLAFELRDTGTHGFILPPDQIEPSSIEFMGGFRELVSQLRTRLGMPPQ